MWVGPGQPLTATWIAVRMYSASLPICVTSALNLQVDSKDFISGHSW